MNQQLEQIQEQIREQRMLDKSNFLVANKRIRLSSCKESKNIWMIANYSTPRKWYVVKWNEELDALIRAFEYFAAGSCIHIFAADACIYLQAKKF